MAIPNRTVGAGRLVRSQRPASSAPAVPSELETVREVEILFTDGTIYTATLVKDDVIDDNNQGTVIIRFANEADEHMFINKNNLCYLNVRTVERAVPLKQYIPVEQRARRDRIQRGDGRTPQSPDTSDQGDFARQPREE